MALNFQLPSFVKPQEYEGISNIPRTIDEIYNTYLRAKQSQGQQALQSSELDLRKLQIEQAKREIAAKNFSEQMQWGAPISQITPGQIAEARMPEQATGFSQGPVAPGQSNPFQSQIDMAQGSAPVHPVVAKLRQLMQSGDKKALFDYMKEQADFEKTQAETAKARKQTEIAGLPSNFNEWITGEAQSGKMDPERAAKLISMASPSFGVSQQKQEDKKAKVAASEAAARAHAFDVVDAAKSALGLITKFGTTGRTGKVAEYLLGEDRMALQGAIDTLKANLSFERLSEMRANSPTGGALGQVSDNELRLLSSTVASLSLNQGEEVLAKNINRVLAKYQEITGESNKPTDQAPKTGEEILKKVKMQDGGIKTAIYSASGKFLRYQ